MKLKHKNITKAYEDNIFKDVFTIKHLMKNIEEKAKNIPLVYPVSVDEIENDPEYECKPHKDRNMYKGMMFEVFVEAFLCITRNDKDIGVHNVNPIEIGDDLGVDFVGKSTRTDEDNDVCIQAKYRNTDNKEFSYKELSTFMSTAANSFNCFGRSQILITTVKYIKDVNHVVNYYVTTVNPDIRIIDRTFLERKVDNNEGFWNELRNLVEISKKEQIDKNVYSLYPHQEIVKEKVMKWLTL